MGQCDNLSMLLLLWTMAGVYIGGSDGLRDVRVEGPGYVRRGDSVTLTCKYDMERDTLYALKWYRGSQEFYRYVPKEVPPIQIFSLPGINVDSQLSNEHDVVLVDMRLEVSGTYKCVVSAETTFQTGASSKELIVVVGYGSPFLSVDQQVFHGGEVVKANCSIGQTAPSANITWYLGDQEVRPEKGSIRTFSVADLNDTAVSTTVSMMTFELPESFTTMRLKCKGTLFDVYSESSIFDIHRTSPRRYPLGSSADTLLRSNSTNSGFAQDFHHPGGLIALLALAQLLLYFIKLKTAEEEQELL